ncbi:MAG: hypothetical protein WCT04_00550 [Planctomycetota bacterium]
MKKDMILSLSVVLGVASVCFGTGFLALAHLFEGGAKSAESAAVKSAGHDVEKDEHGNAAKGAAHGEEKSKSNPATSVKTHGETTKSQGAHAEAPDKPATVPASPAILKEIESHFNDLWARDRFDECRDIAAKAMTLVGHDHAAWQLRLAKATMQSDSLPKQQRYVKALQLNTNALAEGMDKNAEESARYGACVCLRQLSRWEELTQGTEAYMKQFKLTVHTPEILLFHALGISAEGRNADARAEFDSLTGNDTPDAIRAQAMWHIAQLNLKEADARLSEPPIQAQNVALERSPQPATADSGALDLGSSLRDHVLEKMTKQPKAPPDRPTADGNLADLPDEQWELIRRALERSDHLEAQRLFEPYLSAAPDDQRARMSVKYANMMVKIAANRRLGSDGK